MFTIKSRQLFLFTFLYVTGIILFALYLQYYQNLAPCPLCMLQRVTFILIGFTAIVAVIHNPMIYGMRKYAIINLVFCILGLVLAGRHMWLENLPPGTAPTCGFSDLSMMLEVLPIFDALKLAFIGSGDCAKVVWSFMGLSLADWSTVCFVFLFAVNLNIALKPVGRF